MRWIIAAALFGAVISFAFIDPAGAKQQTQSAKY